MEIRKIRRRRSPSSDYAERGHFQPRSQRPWERGWAISRGTGSRGVENAGSGGKRVVRWKTRDLVENAGSGGKRVVWWKTR